MSHRYFISKNYEPENNICNSDRMIGYYDDLRYHQIDMNSEMGMLIVSNQFFLETKF